MESCKRVSSDGSRLSNWPRPRCPGICADSTSISELDSFDVNLDRLLGRKLDLKDAVVTPEEVSPDELLDTGIFGSSFSKSDKVIVEADLGQLPWSHFESLVAEIVLREYGGRVLLTPQSNDKGADVVVMGDSVNVLIQCKHTKQDQLKSELPLREIHSARPF